MSSISASPVSPISAQCPMSAQWPQFLPNAVLGQISDFFQYVCSKIWLSKTSSNAVNLAWLISDFMNVWNLAKCFATFLHCILLKKWSPKNHIRGGVSEPLNFRFSAVRSREYRFTHMDYSLIDIPFLSEALSGERIWVILKVANLMRKVWWLQQEEKEKKEKKLIWRFA